MEKTTLSPEAREARNQYMREYRAKNKDKTRAYYVAHWERKAEEMRRKKDANEKDD